MDEPVVWLNEAALSAWVGRVVQALATAAGKQLKVQTIPLIMQATEK